MSDVSIEALYPTSLATCSVDEFKEGMKGSDVEMDARNAAAKAAGAALRYVASISEKGLKVRRALSRLWPLLVCFELVVCCCQF